MEDTMKGIILAGGNGTRLQPLTITTSKQLLPVYNKPLIYYPLSTLISIGIREVLIITKPSDTVSFMKLLGDGKRFGIHIEYEEQAVADGLAQAFIIGEKFLEADDCTLILGDNLFYGEELTSQLRAGAKELKDHATVFLSTTNTPEAFGVVELDDKGNVISIEEKPIVPKSNMASTGIYMLDGRAPKLAKTLNKSTRGEYEVTDLIKIYLREGRLKAKILHGDSIWYDTGTFDNLLLASNKVKELESLGKNVGDPSKTAESMGFINYRLDIQ